MNKVVCPGCSCLCDDLEVKPEGQGSIQDQLPATKNCPLAIGWYQAAREDVLKPLDEGELRNRMGTSSKVLANSKSVLVTGLNHLSTSAQSLAWKLADRTSGIIDVGFSDSTRAATLAFQQLGKVTATLGEIANRSDLIVYWFCDPMTSHPRLHERIFRGKERGDKRVIVFHHHETITANEADEFHQVKKENAPLLLQTLHGIISDANIDLDAISKQLGVSTSQLQQWAALLTSGSYGSVFIGEQACLGQGLGNDSQFNSPVEHWFRLVRELNNKTRFVLNVLQPPGNGLSAANMLTSLTGFPFAVSLLRDVPEFNWLEYSTVNVLNRQQCDAIVYFGTAQQLTDDAQENLSSTGLSHLNSIPKIIIGPAQTSHTDLEHVTLIPVSRPGWSSGGDFVRYDDVALPMEPIVTTQLPSASDVLTELIDLIES